MPYGLVAVVGILSGLPKRRVLLFGHCVRGDECRKRRERSQVVGRDLLLFIAVAKPVLTLSPRQEVSLHR